MSKKLDETGLRTELSGSAFFGSPPRSGENALPKDRDQQTTPMSPSTHPTPEPEPAELTDNRDHQQNDAVHTRPTLGPLDEIAKAGYTQHSYRFKAEETRWLNQFCLDASAILGRTVHHNTLMRALFRIADEEWKSDPDGNRLLKLLSQLKD